MADSDDAGGVCVSGGITFDLTVNSTDPVYYSGGSQPGWLQSTACGAWYAISPAGGSPVNVDHDCFHSCPRPEAEPVTNQSFTWDGTTWPFADADTSVGIVCDTAVCAAPGNYVATICVGYAGADAGASAETAPPTCKQVPFVWPPTSANQTFVETITPTLDGG